MSSHAYFKDIRDMKLKIIERRIAEYRKRTGKLRKSDYACELLRKKYFERLAR